MDVVVVESPAKAKTINKYLGPGYTVLASFGHVRDLPAKDGSVRPEADFAMDWEADGRGEKQVAAIAKALKGADTLYLATDPDREGEAISWHVREMLAARRALRDVTVRRIVFNEITRSAVRHAIEHPRGLDDRLIQAYLARRALDYLVGFTLSPVLWRKLPGSRSAGRVQSVALRLICEREAEIEAFRAQEYWTVEASFLTPLDASFTARLTHLDGRKLEKFDLPDEAAAMRAKAAVEAGSFTVASVDRRRVRRNPPPPFTTSTLQQEASRKLGLGASRTMRLAQQLYEGVDIGGETVGLITYMRTDGVQMAQEAIGAIRDHIGGRIGGAYLPERPRHYATRAKNAQEAHEAIRPTDVARTPDSVARALNEDQRRLYELVWKRAVASQMASAELDQVTVDLATPDRRTALRATGSILAFDGFLRLYHEDADEPAEEGEENRMLPPMAEGDSLRRQQVAAEQHFTQPPPRYSEASLVKKLEELGIGRPSTYASILSVLQERDYVRLDKRRFIPEDRGRLVTAFLTSFFEHYVAYDFTAALEEQLDDISGGRAEWTAVLRAFWDAFSQAVDQTRDLSIGQVIEALDRDLGPHFFPARTDGSDPRGCPACGDGRLGLRLGKFGAFIGCSNYPACSYTRRLAVDTGEENGGVADTVREGTRTLGTDPATGRAVTLRRGPYGLYVQLGEAEGKEKPPRVSLPRGLEPDSLELERALGLLALPREVGRHPENGDPIYAGIGRFGPYVRLGSTFKSLPPDEDVLTIGLNRAVALLADAAKRSRELGPHPADGAPVTVSRGRFGPYVAHGGLYASLPRGVEMEAVTLDEAVALLKDKGKPGKRAGKAKGAAAGKDAGRRAGTADSRRAAAARPGAAKTGAAKAGAKKAGAKKGSARKPGAGRGKRASPADAD